MASHAERFRLAGRMGTLGLCMAALLAPARGQNLFPDPGFEAGGTPGVGRGGTRAGVLRVQERQHWAALGGDLAVEPFATYRATAFVKGAMTSGTGYALYSYSWNSYGWAFMHNVVVTRAEDWQAVTTTFVVPADKVSFYPLAMSDAAASELYVDDVSLERIRSAEETMNELLAKPNPSSVERQLLARYHLARNDEAAALRLMTPDDAAANADIACLMAQRARGEPDRLRYVAQMIRWECLRWPDAPKRLRELTRGAPPAARLGACLEAAAAGGSPEWAPKAFRILFDENALWKPAAGRTIAAVEGELAAARAALAGHTGSLQATPAGAALLAAVTESLDAAAAAVAERRRSLGTCRVTIGGTPVTPESHAIVIPAQATPSERHAAADLAAHWEQMTGWAPPVVTPGGLGTRHPIAVGRCTDIIQRLGLSVDFAKLGLEGIHLENAGPALVLAGGQRGALYAVYTFLEDILGCRWFTADCVTIPREGLFAVEGLKRVYVPPLEYRDTDYPCCRPPEFGVRNKLNGLYSQADASWGEHIRYKGFVHTFNALVPPETYFAAHPEYYSEINGVRVGPDRTQLCLTNPDVLRIATETVRRWLRESPEATIVSVSQNDWHNYCQCPACTALAEKEGSQSGPLLHFVNGIANAVAAEFPDKIIDTLAYTYTRKPPRFVRPAPNVAVRLCSIECCFVHPLESCPANASFVADIEGWARICNRLHIWDYVINYAHSVQPFPNLRVLRPNIEFFTRHGVTGIYEEANYFSKGGELAELRTYILAKTLWDPAYDTDRAIREFTEAYYGPAAEAIRAYLDLVHDTVCGRTDRHVRIYTSPNDYLNDPEMLSRAEALFDRAEASVAADPVRLHRVQVARLPLLYTRIALSRGALRLRDGKLVPETAGDVSTLLARFEAVARKEGVSHLREGDSGLDAWLEAQKSRAQAVDILTLRSPHLAADVIPSLGGRIWRLEAIAPRRQMLKVFGDPATACAPAEGGYEEYSTGDYRAPGWSEPYRVVESGPDRAVLEATLRNGYALRRSIRLLPDRPAMVVQSTLTNLQGTRRSTLRIHPAFQVESTAAATLWLRRPDGTWQSHSLANPADPAAEKELWLRDQARPAGQWAIQDSSTGLIILNTFDPAEVATAYCNWNGAQARVNLEQWSPARQLEPNASLTITNTYEIIAGPGPWQQ